jgi:hypothetical protein
MKVGLILPMSDDDGRQTPAWPQICAPASLEVLDVQPATPATFAQVLDGIARSRPPR